VYSSQPSFVLGFHGCDASLAEDVFSGKKRLKIAQNSYDWIGNGVYFWENSPERASKWAEDEKRRKAGKVKTPAVIGAVIDLGLCLSLFEAKALQLVKETHQAFLGACATAGVKPPRNEDVEGRSDHVLRHLDCAVIEFLHATRTSQKLEPFDSIRAPFFEGDPLYEKAGFQDKNHVQICVRNPNCIKGYFRVIEPVQGFRVP
jgi:hypothetical protein